MSWFHLQEAVHSPGHYAKMQANGRFTFIRYIQDHEEVSLVIN